MSNCIRESSNAANPHSYGESFSAVGRLGPSRLPITISAMPIPVATKRNSRVGRYSASTLVSLGYWPRERPLLGSCITPGTHVPLQASGMQRAFLPEDPRRTTQAFRFLVPKGGLEPPRPKPLPPQGSASTNPATWANLATRAAPGAKHRHCKYLSRLAEPVAPARAVVIAFARAPCRRAAPGPRAR